MGKISQRSAPQVAIPQDLPPPKDSKYPSPLRYPGGKSWLIPLVRTWIKTLEHPHGLNFVEPFAGGANVGLAMLLDGRVKHLYLADIDPDVSAFWNAVLEDPDWLIDQILYFPHRRDVLIELLQSGNVTGRERGFITLLRNRTARGGVIGSTGGLLRRGENGNGVFSRWYPDTLAKRVESIKMKRDAIVFGAKDAFEVISEVGGSTSHVLFLDPPYSFDKESAGHRLYGCSDVSFEKLMLACSETRAKYILCYEDSSEVRKTAESLGAICRTVKVRNSHNKLTKEIIISNDPSIANLASAL
jgi:DNA adenine methylase